MAAPLRHRGPDDAGVWTDPAAGVAFAHRRLAILDLSPAGHQPMTSSCGRRVLIYNGEIYHHAELRDELSASGRTFRGHSDTEVLVEACAAWGVEATLRKLIGMFAFAVWDRAARTLTLARDRLGLKPLFWGRFGELFLFAPEIKGLRAHPGWRPEIDRGSLRAYMRWGHVPAPNCIYRGLHKLLPGEFLVLAPGGEPKVSSYWDPAQVVVAAQSDRLQIGETEALEGLDSLLGDAVARRMVADVPLGAFLSGGIDSSLIVAFMQARSSRPINTFTIGFDEKRYDESAHARAVAKHLGAAHSEVVVSSDDASALVPGLPYWFDEPLAIRSQIPVMLLSRLARCEVTVALSGDGGDELFGGYPGYHIVRAVHRLTAGLSPTSRRLFADSVDGLVAGLTALHGIIPAGRRPELLANRVKQVTAVVRAGGGISELYAQLYSTTAGQLPLIGTADEHPMRWQAAQHRDIVTDPIDRMGYFALLGTLIDGTLAKIDRASMAYGLEVRVPFLDHRVVEYAWRLPPELKYGNQAGSKHLLRRLLYRHVPPELVDRPKKGFSSPLPVWLRGPLREWADELLNERHLKEEGLFEPTAIRECWNQHLAVASDHWQLLWNVLMFRQWRSYWESDHDRQHSQRSPDVGLLLARYTPAPCGPRSAPWHEHAPPPGQSAQKAPTAPPGGIAPSTGSAHPARPHSEGQPLIWLVLGDKEGDNAQVHAIERALGWSCERRHVHMRAPWVVGKPRVLPSLHHIDRARSDALEPPWPDLVITIGRRPSMVALWIAEQSGGRTRLVLVGKPSGMTRRFDLVIASAEINLPPFDNVVPIALPLMGVEEQRITPAVAVWRERLAELPRPLVAFLIGGATRPFGFDRADTERLIELARGVVVAGGTPYLSTSRRTSATTADALRAGLPASARFYRWTPGDSDNPYLGLLGLADGFVVTSDSISMLVEIVRLRRPLGILELRPRGLGRLDQSWHALIRHLCASGTDSAGGALENSIARGRHGLGLFDGTRDIPAFCRMLFERGFAVPAGAPLLPPRGEITDDHGRVVARIRALMGSGSEPLGARAEWRAVARSRPPRQTDT